MKCKKCRSLNYHPSGWRWHDIFWLPFLLLPMRCRGCLRRDHRSLFLLLWARFEESKLRSKQTKKQILRD